MILFSHFHSWESLNEFYVNFVWQTADHSYQPTYHFTLSFSHSVFSAPFWNPLFMTFSLCTNWYCCQWRFETVKPFMSSIWYFYSFVFFFYFFFVLKYFILNNCCSFFSIFSFLTVCSSCVCHTRKKTINVQMQTYTKYIKMCFCVPCNHNIVDTNDTNFVTIRTKCFIVYPFIHCEHKNTKQWTKHKLWKKKLKIHRLTI